MQSQTPEEHRSGVASYPPDHVAVGFGPMIGYVSGNYNSKEVWFDASLIDPNRSLAVIDHSPDGFNWSYHGSGPSQLALAILLEMESRGEVDRTFVLSYYQSFKRHYLASLPPTNFAIGLADIREWARAISNEKGAES